MRGEKGQVVAIQQRKREVNAGIQVLEALFHTLKTFTIEFDDIPWVTNCCKKTGFLGRCRCA